MLKSGGGNGTSFLNSRKAKRVLSAFYFWKMAAKFQEMGGILGFVPWNADSVGRKLFSFPWNFVFFPWNFVFFPWNFVFFPCNFVFFPCNFFFVRWNFYFLGHFFDYKP